MGKALSVDHVQERREGLALVSIDCSYFLFPDVCYVHEIIRIEGAVQSKGVVRIATEDSWEFIYVFLRLD